MAEQQQFDWQKETAKCVEGLKFDLDEEYPFELVWENVSLHNIVKKNDDGSSTEIVYKKGAKAGQPIKMYTFPFKELNSNVEFKLEFFHNDSYRVNPANPELEDDIVKLSRKLGYNPVLDGNFSIADFIKPGLSFTAKLCYQKPTKANEVLNEVKGVIETPDGKEIRKAYKTIDISTINASESGSTEKQAELSEDAVEEVMEMKKGCKKFSELVSKINKAGKSDELLDVAMRMKEQGKIKF